MAFLVEIVTINLIFLGGKVYSQVIVSYDIEDNKLRKKLFDELKNLGLMSIQKSVFWGYVLTSEKRVIKTLFKSIVKIVIKPFWLM